ncbi:TraB/GumN family protein [Luteimonas yindakuii]|nr:TraB/GumN family protein [Luteimonas yindakuii]
MAPRYRPRCGTCWPERVRTLSDFHMNGARMAVAYAGTLAALLMLGLASGTAAAVDPVTPVETAADRVVDLETLVVSGTQPGPGMWKVSWGDNTLYILGTVSPLPRRMEWESAEVEAVVARSQAVIAPPMISVGTDIGFFRGMTLVPALLRARNNPGKRPLREAVTPELYARWEVLKARYIGRDRGVERRRPLLAAQELYEAALRRSGLRMSGVIWPVVTAAAKSAGVAVTDTTVRLPVEDPRRVLEELNSSDLADRECFEGTMARIETDLDNMRARANAWAVGDIEALAALPYEDHYRTCMDALTGSALARRLGLDDLQERAAQAWLDNVEQALAQHPTSFSMLAMQHLLGDGGMLERLAAKGYAIEAP